MHAMWTTFDFTKDCKFFLNVLGLKEDHRLQRLVDVQKCEIHCIQLSERMP